jgi:2-polyprenyl-3-methyl-5-hydroxy-6-metoxy-1,4-benzoquinol methylase
MTDSPDKNQIRSLQERLNKVRQIEGRLIDHQQVLRSRPSHRVRIDESARLVEKYARGYVLDLGCAEGYFCGLSKIAGATRVLGIDVSPDKIARARECSPTCDFKVGDLTDLNLPIEPADVVLCFEVIQHLADYREGLSRLNMSTKKHGRLILSIPNLSPLEEHVRSPISSDMSEEVLVSEVGGGGLGKRNGVWLFHFPTILEELDAIGFRIDEMRAIDSPDGERMGIWWVGAWTRVQ